MVTDVRSATVLVVDDNPSSLYSTSRVLRGVGWRVLEATTGREGIERLGAGVDLVVLDVNLPDINGFEVCRLIRENPATCRIAVIHLSASFINNEARVHGLESGADGYLTHPVEPPVLIATVNAFLRTRLIEAERESLLASERMARAEAERANRFKDDFLATLSHELRTPLNAIVGWAQLLQMHTLDPSEAKNGMEAIERNARALAQMIADLLDVSRISSGKLRLDAQPVDAASVVDSALSVILPAANAKEIRIQRSIDARAGTISGDPARLQQIVWNLIQNAVKFTPERGTIHIKLHRIERQIEIRVTDNGQGISHDLLPRVFDRFQQGDASTTRIHGGLGLGLAIVKQLVELHGGTIQAESDGEGRGASFAVLLPIADGYEPHLHDDVLAATEKIGRRERLAVDLLGIQVLIVDDDQDARELSRRIVEECRASVTYVDNVSRAVEAVTQLKPDILISDLGMPGADGFELIEYLRAQGFSAQDLPAVALTAFARPEDRRRALLAGFQVHLTKPVDPFELTTVIATLTGRNRT